MIVGTAGHIDHGKSSLIAALTGRPMDRLEEERRRGITIDLNFAPLDLGDGRLAGVVDVPGHEDFVRTMVAGASGFDLALLVVAADEGVMPQTAEHLAILEQLGVTAGIPVITKADLVEPDWLELVALELDERLRASSVAFEEPVAVSVVTGQGLDTLRARLRDHAARIRPRSRDDAFRLPVDRAFSASGVGTVVTGTAWSGSLAIGDRVVVLPGGAEARVRSLESHGRALERSEPGARVAVGLAGLDRVQVARGDVLVTAELPWAPSQAVDVEISLSAAAARPLAARSRVRFHLGTAEVMARVLPRGPIEPGRRGLARLRLEAPVVARGGDRFVLRSYSPVTTIGGGRVLDPRPPLRGAKWPEGLAATDPKRRLHALVARRPYGIEAPAGAILLGVPSAEALAAAAGDPDLRIVGQHWVLGRTVEETATRALDLIRDFHRRQPSERGIPLETLRSALRAPDWLTEAALGDLIRARRARTVHGVTWVSGFEPRVAGGEAEIDRVVDILTRAGLAPPTVAELEREMGRHDVAALLRLAAARGRVEGVERDRYYAGEALQRFTATLREVGRAGDIQPAAVRERLGISRKFLIPLLEWADGRGITVRVGDIRRLAVPRNRIVQPE
jgi:selenocysteine-specific elongation factor